MRGRDSSVGIATRYGLDSPGIESRLGARFSASVQTGPGAHPASYTMGTASFPGVKRPGRGVDHPPPSSTEVEGRVELYICSPSGPSWPVLGRTLPLLLTYIYIYISFLYAISFIHLRFSNFSGYSTHSKTLCKLKSSIYFTGRQQTLCDPGIYTYVCKKRSFHCNRELTQQCRNHLNESKLNSPVSSVFLIDSSFICKWK